VNIHSINSIENFVTVQDFWVTCPCPEKQSLPWDFSLCWNILIIQDFWGTLRYPWNFSLYWNIFYHSGFLSNLCLPWKQSLPWKLSVYWIYFLHSRFLSNLCLPWKQSCPEICHSTEFFLPFRIFEQLALALKTEFALKIFTVFNILFTFRIFEQLVLALKTEFALKFITKEIFFVIQDFWATFPCPKNRVCPEIFQAGGAFAPLPIPRLVRLCSLNLFVIWKLTI